MHQVNFDEETQHIISTIEPTVAIAKLLNEIHILKQRVPQKQPADVGCPFCGGPSTRRLEHKTLYTGCEQCNIWFSNNVVDGELSSIKWRTRHSIEQNQNYHAMIDLLNFIRGCTGAEIVWEAIDDECPWINEVD